MSRVPFLTLAIIYGSALFILALTVLASLYIDSPITIFTRDPTTTLRAHPLTGALSHLGVLMWWAAAAICLFSWAILHHTQNNRTLFSFFLWSGALTSVLTLDDLFLFHEDLAYRYLRLDERIILLGYASVAIWWCIRFRRIILDSAYPLLFLAIGFFGLSIGIDLVETGRPSWFIFWEDAFKLLGIVSWSSYLMRASFHAMATTVNSQNACPNSSKVG